MRRHRYLRRNKDRRVYRNGRSGTVYRPGTDYIHSRNHSLDMYRLNRKEVRMKCHITVIMVTKVTTADGEKL